MAIQSVKNQYRGINDHLNSKLQSAGGWDSFHTSHISDLTKAMKAGLRPLGYTADIEQSLQIRRYGEPPLLSKIPIPIYDLLSGRQGTPEPFQAGDTHEIVLSIPRYARRHRTGSGISPGSSASTSAFPVTMLAATL